VSSTGRLVGLVVAVGMFIFSSWMYLQTGDWVAVVFALGSVGYGLYFLYTDGSPRS
jgi:hypothetical protein